MSEETAGREAQENAETPLVLPGPPMAGPSEGADDQVVGDTRPTPVLEPVTEPANADPTDSETTTAGEPEQATEAPEQAEPAETETEQAEPAETEAEPSPEVAAAVAEIAIPVVARTPLIAGNWKMNLDHLQAIAHVQKVSWSLKDVKHDFADVEVAVFPPFTDLRSVQTLLSADKLALRLGAQDVSPSEVGAFTGDVAAAFLSKLDVRYVIVGHSERRQGHGESDETVAAKAKAASAAGMVPVICVGETAEDREDRGAAAVPLAQLEAALAALPSGAEYVVAYEPVWAIGSGEPASPEQAQEVGRALRRRIAELRGPAEAAAVRLLYGGSVASQNIAGFMRQPDIDGALVGGASLDAAEFTRIVQFRKHVTA